MKKSFHYGLLQLIPFKQIHVVVPIWFPFYESPILFSNNSSDKTPQSLFQPF